MLRLALCSFLLLLWTLPAWAREWYFPLHSGKEFVNPHLSVGRVLKHPEARWQNQMVLWQGRLRQVKAQGAGWNMVLETEQGRIPVHCPKAVLTLKPDPREGCLVAVKGQLDFRKGRLQRLVGRSVILLKPAQWQPPAHTEEFLQRWIAFHCPDESATYPGQMARAILTNSEKQGLDPLFFASLLQIESAFRKDAVSPSGAVGLGQLMPFTAEGLAVDPWDPEQNVAGAARMLSGLLQGWKSDHDPRALALASYNAGPTLVRRLQTIPGYAETNNYVYFIGSLHTHMQALNRVRPAL